MTARQNRAWILSNLDLPNDRDVTLTDTDGEDFNVSPVVFADTETPPDEDA